MYEEDKKDIFTTRSLQLASFLLTQEESGIKLLGFDDSDLRNIYFEFSPRKLCQDLENNYLLKQDIKVYPRDLMTAHSVLKEKVFQLQRNR